MKRNLITAVRDPIDHFLSGWAECGVRRVKEITSIRNREYDQRIRDWLFVVKQPICNASSRACGLRTHSFPQSSFLLTSNRTNTTEVEPMINIIGDLTELQHLLEFVGFQFNPSKKIGRNYSSNTKVSKTYPRQKYLLSNSTLRELCKFLELDYYLFDFEPPVVCLDILENEFLSVH